MKTRNRLNKMLGLAVMVAAFTAGAAPVSALAPEADAVFAPAPSESADRVAEDPPKPIVEPGAPPDDVFIQPIPEVTETVPPKIDAATFGVGWPAAAAVGVALLAVLIMALTWKRDESW